MQYDAIRCPKRVITVIGVLLPGKCLFEDKLLYYLLLFMMNIKQGFEIQFDLYPVVAL